MKTSKNTKGLKALIEVISELNKMIEFLNQRYAVLKKENEELKSQLS